MAAFCNLGKECEFWNPAVDEFMAEFRPDSQTDERSGTMIDMNDPGMKQALKLTPEVRHPHLVHREAVGRDPGEFRAMSQSATYQRLRLWCEEMAAWCETENTEENAKQFTEEDRQNWLACAAALDALRSERATLPEGWVAVPQPKGMRSVLEKVGHRLRDFYANRFALVQPIQHTDIERQVLLAALTTLDAALAATAGIKGDGTAAPLPKGNEEPK